MFRANELRYKNSLNNIFPIIAKSSSVNLNIVGASRLVLFSWLRSNNQTDLCKCSRHCYALANATLILHPHAGGSGIQNKL